MSDNYNFAAAGIKVIDQNKPTDSADPILAVAEPVARPSTEPDVAVVPTPAAIAPSPAPLTPAEKILEVPKIEKPEFDEAKYIKDSFGDIFSSKEDVKAMIEKAKDVNDLRAKLKEKEDYIAENDFVDEYARAENKFVKQGGDRKIFKEVNDLDIENMSEEEAIKKKLQIQNKTLTKDEIDRLIKRKYKIGDEDQDDDDVKDANINLKMDGRAAKDFLGKYKADNSVPPSVKQETEAQKKQVEAAENATKNLKSWTDNYDAVAPKTKKISFDLSADDKENYSMDYEMNFNSDDLKKEALSVIGSYGLKYGDEGAKKALESFLVNRRIQEELPNIVKAIAGKVKTDRDLFWIEKTNNPGILKTQDVAPSTTNEKEVKLRKLVEAYK